MAILHVKSPDGTDYNMTIETSGTTESIQPNGWCKLPNRLMIQWQTWWDTVNAYAGPGYFSSGNVIWPTVFPNGTIMVLMCPSEACAWVTLSTRNVTSSGMGAFVGTIAAQVGDQRPILYILCMGY